MVSCQTDETAPELEEARQLLTFIILYSMDQVRTLEKLLQSSVLTC
jgi:hypothetical protein